MQKWHSLYELLNFPIAVLFFAEALMAIGNLLVNPAFASLIQVRSDFVILLANAIMRTGSFLIVNFPLLFLLRLVARKAGSGTTMISAFAGYIGFQMMNMYFAKENMPSTVYSSILGISMTSTNGLTMQSGVHYPFQTGVAACALVAFLTLSSFSRSRLRSEYSLLSFISKDVWCVIRTVFWASLGGILVARVWPYLIDAITQAIEFIAEDTSNPVNLIIYGLMDRFLSILNLSAIIRTPFWYGSNGGSWVSVAGLSISGDVNIWTSQLAAGSLNGMAGRFITPYYVINLFAIPGLLWGMFSIQTDRLERRRNRMLCILLTLISMLGGILLPMDLMLVLLCPLLFLFHAAYSSVLFGVFQAMHVYLGYNYSGTSAITAMPGTLFELLSYLPGSSMLPAIIRVVIVGAITFVAYFLLTRIYFRFLAVDLFHTGGRDRMVQGTLDAIGGVSNIKQIHSSCEKLTISLYDPRSLNAAKLRELGAVRVTETKAGFAISFGAASTMIRLGIQDCMRQNIRSV